MDIVTVNLFEEVGEVMARIVEFQYPVCRNMKFMALDQEISRKENADSQSSALPPLIRFLNNFNC